VMLYRSSPKICIDIKDLGTGIPLDKLEQIFERGYSSQGGTGLGLALARATLQKYGGRIFVKKNEPEVDVTFTIELNEAPLI
jgi:signal transduction histidine kinase